MHKLFYTVLHKQERRALMPVSVIVFGIESQVAIERQEHHRLDRPTNNNLQQNLCATFSISYSTTRFVWYCTKRKDLNLEQRHAKRRCSTDWTCHRTACLKLKLCFRGILEDILRCESGLVILGSHSLGNQRSDTVKIIHYH